MKQLLNTLFVTSEDIYLSLEGENVLALSLIHISEPTRH